SSRRGSASARTIPRSPRTPAASCRTTSPEEPAMEFLKLSLSGFDDFLVYFGLSLLFVALYLAIYVHVTPYREFALIREGNAAAAASLSGSLIGFVLPLASAVIHSVNTWDMALWAAIALVVQIAVYAALRLLM